MIDKAIQYIKDVVESLESQKLKVETDFLTIKQQKEQLTLDREALTRRESAFLTKVDGHGLEVERIRKMSALAKKIKAKADEDMVELKIDNKKLDKRESDIEDLEKKDKKLKAREELLETREINIEERELLVQKEKLSARDKQKDNEIRANAIKKKQTLLQSMIDRQRL